MYRLHRDGFSQKLPPPPQKKNVKIQDSIYQEWNVWRTFSQLWKD